MTPLPVLTVIENKLSGTSVLNQQQVKLINTANGAELKLMARPIFNLAHSTLLSYRYAYLSRKGLANLIRAIEFIHSPNEFNHILKCPFYRTILAKKEIFFEILFNNDNTVITRENAHDIRDILFNETNLNDFVKYFKNLLRPLAGHTRYVKEFEVFDPTAYAYNDMSSQVKVKLVESELIHKLTQSGFELNWFTTEFKDGASLSFHQSNFDFRVTLG